MDRIHKENIQQNVKHPTTCPIKKIKSCPNLDFTSDSFGRIDWVNFTKNLFRLIFKVKLGNKT